MEAGTPAAGDRAIKAEVTGIREAATDTDGTAKAGQIPKEGARIKKE